MIVWVGSISLVSYLGAVVALSKFIPQEKTVKNVFSNAMWSDIEQLYGVFPIATGSGYRVLIGFHADRCDSRGLNHRSTLDGAKHRD